MARCPQAWRLKALNNAGALDARLIVILTKMNMSIAPADRCDEALPWRDGVQAEPIWQSGDFGQK